MHNEHSIGTCIQRRTHMKARPTHRLHGIGVARWLGENFGISRFSIWPERMKCGAFKPKTNYRGMCTFFDTSSARIVRCRCRRAAVFELIDALARGETLQLPVPDSNQARNVNCICIRAYGRLFVLETCLRIESRAGLSIYSVCC